MPDIHQVLVHCSAAVFSGALATCLFFRHKAMVLTTNPSPKTSEALSTILDSILFFFVFIKDVVQPSRFSSSRCSTDRTTDLKWHHFIKLLARIGGKTSMVEPEVPQGTPRRHLHPMDEVPSVWFFITALARGNFLLPAHSTFEKSGELRPFSGAC